MKKNLIGNPAAHGRCAGWKSLIETMLGVLLPPNADIIIAKRLWRMRHDDKFRVCADFNGSHNYTINKVDDCHIRCTPC
ncbi:hypothetical protein DMENIID0001_035730 [Sergentomyia squamirostris]